MPENFLQIMGALQCFPFAVVVVKGQILPYSQRKFKAALTIYLSKEEVPPLAADRQTTVVLIHGGC